MTQFVFPGSEAQIISCTAKHNSQILKYGKRRDGERLQLADVSVTLEKLS